MKKTSIIIIVSTVFILSVTMTFIFNGIYQNKVLFNAIKDMDYDMAISAIEKGAFINLRKDLMYIPEISHTNPTPLILACKKGDIQLIDLLLDNGADINKKDNYTGQTPLLASLKSGKSNRFSIAFHLIEKGADINYKQKTSPLLYKATYISESDSEETIKESLFLVKCLLNNGVTEEEYKGGENLLTYACRYRNFMVVEYLLENKYYDVNCYDDNGDTALIVAVKYNQKKCVEILKQYGADTSSKDSNGFTASDYAV